MAEAFEPAVGLARDSAAAIIFAVENVEYRAARIRQAEIFHRHKLGDRETVMDFGQRNLGARIGDARLGISALGGDAGVANRGAVPFDDRKRARQNSSHY